MQLNVAGRRPNTTHDSLKEPLLSLVQRLRHRVTYAVTIRVIYWVICRNLD